MVNFLTDTENVRSQVFFPQHLEAYKEMRVWVPEFERPVFFMWPIPISNHHSWPVPGAQKMH